MASDENGERPKLSPEVITFIDGLYLDPKERAEAVWGFIQREWAQTNPGRPLPRMDVLCFCVEYIGMMAQGLGNEDFLIPAKLLAQWLYNAHYNNPEVMHGAPDRGPVRGPAPASGVNPAASLGEGLWKSGGK